MYNSCTKAVPPADANVIHATLANDAGDPTEIVENKLDMSAGKTFIFKFIREDKSLYVTYTYNV